MPIENKRFIFSLPSASSLARSLRLNMLFDRRARESEDAESRRERFSNPDSHSSTFKRDLNPISDSLKPLLLHCRD